MTIYEMRCIYPSYAAKERDLERLQQEVNRSPVLDRDLPGSWVARLPAQLSTISTP